MELSSDDLAGLIVLDKPLGRTSNAMCTLVRGRLRAAGWPRRSKVGHAGTLDPLATGVLLILVGRATRLCESLMSETKEYEAEIDLAHTSDSFDLERAAHPIDPGPPRTCEELAEVLARFIGDFGQVPPIHSAAHVDGRRAYVLARAGQDPLLRPKRVRVDALDLLEIRWPVLRVRIVSGRGFYVRSLARDLGEALGTGGMLTSLRRTRVGQLSAAAAVTPEQLPARLGASELARLTPPGIDPTPLRVQLDPEPNPTAASRPAGPR
ncbi:MAG: tRNA pseudouridine(55) synthase TruB [Phycisphaeraceae bacterium]|nr:tRNA pseudouridine(55) synthase TruB [Phycisphaeraceae bacterium]